MYKGSCLCGVVRYEVACQPSRVSHCHCSMCQKQHGAAFATYASFPAKHLIYVQGEASLQTFFSSPNVCRKFCSVCGSNLEWRNLQDPKGWTAMAIASFDTPFYPQSIVEIYTDEKVCWLLPDQL